MTARSACCGRSREPDGLRASKIRCSGALLVQREGLPRRRRSCRLVVFAATEEVVGDGRLADVVAPTFARADARRRQRISPVGGMTLSPGPGTMARVLSPHVRGNTKGMA